MNEPTRQEIDASTQPTVHRVRRELVRLLPGRARRHHHRDAASIPMCATSRWKTARANHSDVRSSVKLWPTLVYLEQGAEIGRVVRPNNVEEIEAIFGGAKS